jgi:cytochrome c
MFRTVLLLASALTMAACGKAGTESDIPEPAASPGDLASAAPSGAAVPGQCAACHSAEAGKHGIGPSLAGLVGRQAGTLPGYAFSSAMKASALTWDEATLDKFLDHPMQTVPGTKMIFAGIKSPEKRAEVIAQLKAL